MVDLHRLFYVNMNILQIPMGSHQIPFDTGPSYLYPSLCGHHMMGPSIRYELCFVSVNNSINQSKKGTFQKHI